MIQIQIQNSILSTLFFFFSFILIPLLCGVDVWWHTPPCSTVVHMISRQSLLSTAVCLLGYRYWNWRLKILYFVQPSSLRSSSISSFSPVLSFPSPSFLRSVPLFASHAHTTSTFFPVLSLWFPPLSLSLNYSFISDLVPLRKSAHPS